MRRRQLLVNTLLGVGTWSLTHAVWASEQVVSDPSLLALDAGADRYTVKSASKDVQDVIADIEFSITEFNYRLTGTNNVGYAIADRDETAPKRVARVFHFCNIEIAKQLLAAGEEYLLHMPCRLVVWENEGHVWVASRLLPVQGTADETLVTKINNMMRDIADFAVSE